MPTAEQRAMLAWCYENLPDNARTAQHMVNWAGERALAACVTEQDYEVVANVLNHSIGVIHEQANFGPQPQTR